METSIMSDSGFDYGYIKDGKVYLKAYAGFPDREIGVVKEGEQQSLQYFVDRFEIARKKVDEVKQAVEENTNKGSFLMKIIHLKTYLTSFSGLGDFVGLIHELEILESGIEEYIQGNRVKNTEVKLALLAEAETLKDSVEWQETSDLLKELKLNWIKTGSAQKEIEEDIKVRFDQALDYFFAQRKKYYDKQKIVINDRRLKYMSLLRDLKKINANAPEDGEERVEILQEEWKTVGKIQPKRFGQINAEYGKELSKFLSDTLMRIQRAKKSGIDLKKDIFERVERMYDENTTTMPIIKRFQKEWKDVGKLEEEEDKDLNLNFRILCNEIFEAHFLDNHVRTNCKEFADLSLTEQIKLKIRELRESIKTDEYELGMFNTNFYKLKIKEKDPEALKTLNKERGGFINKIKTKQRILKKLQDQLLTSY